MYHVLAKSVCCPVGCPTSHHRSLCVDPGTGHAWVGSDDGTLRCMLVQRVGRRSCRLASVRVATVFGAPAVDSGDKGDEVDEATMAAALHDVPIGAYIAVVHGAVAVCFWVCRGMCVASCACPVDTLALLCVKERQPLHHHPPQRLVRPLRMHFTACTSHTTVAPHTPTASPACVCGAGTCGVPALSHPHTERPHSRSGASLGTCSQYTWSKCSVRTFYRFHAVV